jgi:hypothetical protein
MNTFDPDASGEFACSLHMVDVATGWSEIAAILGKSQLVVADAFGRILPTAASSSTTISCGSGRSGCLN